MTQIIKIVNKNGTPVEVSDDNRLFVEATFSSSGGTGSGVGEVRTPTAIRPTTAGTIAVGTYSVSVSNVGGVDGTFLGVALKAGETINIDAGAIGNTLSAMAYDASGTEFLIITLT